MDDYTKIDNADVKKDVEQELSGGEPWTCNFEHEKYTLHFQHRLCASVLETQDSTGKELFVVWLGHVEDKRSETPKTILVYFLEFKQLTTIEPKKGTQQKGNEIDEKNTPPDERIWRRMMQYSGITREVAEHSKCYQTGMYVAPVHIQDYSVPFTFLENPNPDCYHAIMFLERCQNDVIWQPPNGTKNEEQKDAKTMSLWTVLQE